MIPEQLCEITGLVYCGPDCGCGENSGLLYFPVSPGEDDGPQPWLPSWMNGAPPEEVERWLREHGHLKATAQATGGDDADAD